MKDRLAGISVFVEAVEAGGFSAAAVRLNLSRSSVGKAVARLEARLGVRLFHRTTRSQSLTEDGQTYYEHCLRALETIRTGEAMLESGRRCVSGRLRVSMPVLFGRRCVAPILTDLAHQYPELELDLNFSDLVVNVIEDGFDLVVRNGPLDRSADQLAARKIARQRLVVCAAPSYLEARGTPKRIEDIGEHETIAYGHAGRIYAWRFPKTEDAPAATIYPKARLRFDDIEAIADAAAKGMGIAWLPYWLVRNHILSGELVPILEDRPGLAIEAHALWPQSRHLPLRIRVAIDALVRELPGAVT